MVTLGLRQEVGESNRALEDKVSQQVAEIMESAEMEEEQTGEVGPETPTWKFAMPFAGVRYYSYD